MINLPLTIEAIFVHHYHGVTFPPKLHCQKIWHVKKEDVAKVTNKKKYFTKEDAEKEIKRIGKQSIKPYKCPVCNYWHIGKDKHNFYENIS